jgi:hypothetical protein
MAGAELTPVQRFVLVTLMIKAGTLPNTYLTNTARISLKREYRDDLRNRGLGPSDQRVGRRRTG